jgi:upstream activation factor subunit UAF30
MKKQLCAYCGMVIGEDYFKCRICGKLNCLDCRNTKQKCCIKCAEDLPKSKPASSRKRKSNEKGDSTSKSDQGFLRPMIPSDALAAVIGSRAISRTDASKKIWQYIKKHGLQDPVNPRFINADGALEEVFDGKSRVSMFEMTKFLNKHLS